MRLGHIKHQLLPLGVALILTWCLLLALAAFTRAFLSSLC